MDTTTPIQGQDIQVNDYVALVYSDGHQSLLGRVRALIANDNGIAAVIVDGNRETAVHISRLIRTSVR